MWCVVSQKRVVGPLIFELIITSEVYQYLIMRFILLFDISERDAVFQQNNAHPHVSTSIMAFLLLFFGDKLISLAYGLLTALI